jgi:NADH-quinone oxidoreductase subunit A
MGETMLFNYSNVLIFAAVGIGFIFTTLFIGSLLRPQVPTLEKLSTYECGEEVIGSAWVNFNIRFYVVALVFVVFDVEVAFMFPVAQVYREWIAAGKGAMAFFEILVFILILSTGFIYAWVKGDLDWVKKISQEIKSESEATAKNK